jgi:hypothetical protein
MIISLSIPHTDFIIAEKAANIECDANDTVIVKLDLQQAFTTIESKADAVKHLTMEMSNDRVMFFICGIFGWWGTLGAFHIFTSGILHDLHYRLLGKALMYVDAIRQRYYNRHSQRKCSLLHLCNKHSLLQFVGR